MKQDFLSTRSSLLINVLKCVCCIGVVFLHTLFRSINVGDSDLAISGYGWDVFVSATGIVCRSLVPLFFFISGYLFFLNFKNFSYKWFKRKFQSRIKTLLIPYIFGILIVAFFFFFANIFLGGMMRTGASHTINVLTMFWHPLPNAVFWFLRDLMVVILLSPIVIKLMQGTKWVLLPVIFVLWITDIWRFQIPGLSSISFLFFYLGAFFSLHKIDFIYHLCYGKKLYVLLLYAVLVVFACRLDSELLTKLSILFGIPSIVYITNSFFDDTKLLKFNAVFWMPASFFVYAYHVMTEVVIKKTLFILLRPDSALMNYVIYFTTVFLSILILCSIYYLINKYIPQVAKLLTGR